MGAAGTGDLSGSISFPDSPRALPAASRDRWFCRGKFSTAESFGFRFCSQNPADFGETLIRRLWSVATRCFGHSRLPRVAVFFVTSSRGIREVLVRIESVDFLTPRW
jgi:hypothetical protein